MKKHLFLLTIGPVQSFISQARKTQDLYAGSRLISDLASLAFQMFQAAVGNENLELIFPAFHDKDGKPVLSNPNRFAAVISPNISHKKLSEIGRKVKKDLNASFVRDSLERMPFLDTASEGVAIKQLESHLEIFWAAKPIDENEYQRDFIQLESYINSIKNFRDWMPNPELGRKCGVDGERNVVVYRKTLAESGSQRIHKLFQREQQNIAVIETNEERNVPVWSLEPGEGLSAVSYAKRTFEQIAHKFPSTARVCLLNVVHQIKDWDEFIALENEPKQMLRHSNDHLLFEENINPQLFRKTGLFKNDEDELLSAVKKTKQLHEALTKRMEEAGISEGLNTKYYAIMVFDGDQMGKWLSGQFLQNAQQLKAFQIKMRDLLRDYGIWAMNYLDAEKGKAVYAGGDDFLGFINLNHLYPVLKEMRAQFDLQINQTLQNETKEFRLKEKTMFSFSAGIAIGHYKQPLGMVLDEAREAEYAAKAAGKNAFVISLMRHSGGITRSIEHFGTSEQTLSERLDAMTTVQKQLSKKNFSNKFIHNIIAETRYWNSAINPELFKIELGRLLGRSKNKTANDQDLSEMTSAVMKLYLPPTDSSAEKQLAKFTATLRVCDFIYRITHNNEEA